MPNAKTYKMNIGMLLIVIAVQCLGKAGAHHPVLVGMDMIGVKCAEKIYFDHQTVPCPAFPLNTDRIISRSTHLQVLYN